jgi:hypothetical protein
MPAHTGGEARGERMAVLIRARILLIAIDAEWIAVRGQIRDTLIAADIRGERE